MISGKNETFHEAPEHREIQSIVDQQTWCTCSVYSTNFGISKIQINQWYQIH